MFRTHRFAVLGMSLSNLLDINQPNDLLRGLMNVTTEYDQGKEDGEKPKMVCSLCHWQVISRVRDQDSSATLSTEKCKKTRRL